MDEYMVQQVIDYQWWLDVEEFGERLVMKDKIMMTDRRSYKSVQNQLGVLIEAE